MTLPDERFLALVQSRRFLLDLIDCKATPRIPKAIRLRARYLLKHYPAEFEVECLARKSPEILSKDRYGRY